MDERIEAARFLGRQVLADVESLYLACDLGRKGRRIETGDTADAGFTGEDIGPRFLNPYTDGRNDPQTRYDYSASCQVAP